jgi:hypothetical protein
MALFNIGSNAPQYLEQALFDVSVFRFYSLRHQFDDFQSFWHAKSVGADGGETRLVDSLFAHLGRYPKDDLLRVQLSDACLEVEKYWNKKFGVSPESLCMFAGIKSQAEEALIKFDAEAEKNGSKNAQIASNPDLRVNLCIRNLCQYEGELAKLQLAHFDNQTRVHFFLDGLNEALSSSFKYSGSVLKVLEQDSYAQNDDITWGRWTLFRDSTGYSDIWIVRIDNGRAEVIKTVKKISQDVYELDESVRGIHFDSEIFKAIDKTRLSAYENAELNSSPPTYFHMLEILKANGESIFERG